MRIFYSHRRKHVILAALSDADIKATYVFKGKSLKRLAFHSIRQQRGIFMELLGKIAILSIETNHIEWLIQSYSCVVIIKFEISNSNGQWNCIRLLLVLFRNYCIMLFTVLSGLLLRIVKDHILIFIYCPNTISYVINMPKYQACIPSVCHNGSGVFRFCHWNASTVRETDPGGILKQSDSDEPHNKDEAYFILTLLWRDTTALKLTCGCNENDNMP